jgi:hypothetical protein
MSKQRYSCHSLSLHGCDYTYPCYSPGGVFVIALDFSSFYFTNFNKIGHTCYRCFDGYKVRYWVVCSYVLTVYRVLMVARGWL